MKVIVNPPLNIVVVETGLQSKPRLALIGVVSHMFVKLGWGCVLKKQKEGEK